MLLVRMVGPGWRMLIYKNLGLLRLPYERQVALVGRATEQMGQLALGLLLKTDSLAAGLTAGMAEVAAELAVELGVLAFM